MAFGVAALLATPAAAQTIPLGANLERFAYPPELRWFEADGLRMAYLDFAPQGRANGRTLVLLHGKNFCAVTWEETARALAARGYRVIAPDQVGFCKSSKPAGFQYSFAALASLTRQLLHQAGAGPVTLIGHSTGGVLAIRYALLWPAEVRSLALVNPLGLNDTLAEGVPYAGLAQLRAEEAKTSAATIRGYQLKNYYHGAWRPAYDRWVQMLAGQYAGGDGGVVREAQARLSEMIETQPVAAELARVRQPVTLLIGQEDKTAFRGNTAAAGAHVRAVPEAAESAARAFRQGRLVRLAGLGHAPQVEDPARFGAALIEAVEERR
ncbi:alpha/beta fold hydrolase [Sphingomonas aracearum]|uniref:alpha/beta fold hydrolase n=1 Tax=Sphingomonas aracearum TaxID=2283317 RepID=UPI001EF02885|nr:alpha/beta hydrolase [Sphingomonas aracearum]